MQSNLLIYFRNLRKERIRILNLLSMAFTLAFALLILFFVEDELSFDRWNEYFNKELHLNILANKHILKNMLSLLILVGVVKNFYFTSKQNAIEPLFVSLDAQGKYTGTISVKIAPNAMRGTLRNLNQEWKQFSPDSDFSYILVEDKIRAFYRGEEKVNGASSQRIVKRILLSEFFKPSIASFLMVIPMSHFVITGFLRSTMMEASMSWWIYNLVYFVILLTLVLTTTRQLYKAANKNPVDTLRSEKEI